MSAIVDKFRTWREHARRDRLEAEIDAGAAAIALGTVKEHLLESWEDDEDEDHGRLGPGLVGKKDVPFLTTMIVDLSHARNLSRMLARGHYKAKGILRNTRNLVLGRRGLQVKLKDEAAREAWWAWCAEEAWRKREREAVWRLLRDGEMLLRFFDDGSRLRVRFVDPETLVSSLEAKHGIRFAKDDAETPEAFHVRRGGGSIEADWIDARECVWVKLDTDANEARGLPWLFCLLGLLQRGGSHFKALMASAVLRNAYAIIHKHKAGPEQIAAFVSGLKTGTREVTDSGTKRTLQRQATRPGTHLHVGAGDEVDFKGPNIEAGDQVKLCRELDLCVSQGTGLAEHFQRMDSSVRSMAGIMFSEGPTEAMVEDLQSLVAEEIVRPVLVRVLARSGGGDRELASGEGGAAAAAGEAEITGPRFPRRDREKQVQADLLLVRGKLMSRRTAQVRDGLDPDEEDEEIAQQKETGGLYGDSSDDEEGRDGDDGDGDQDGKDGGDGAENGD